MSEIGAVGQSSKTRVEKPEPPAQPAAAKAKEPEAKPPAPVAPERNPTEQADKRHAHKAGEDQRRTRVGETPDAKQASEKWPTPSADQRRQIQDRTRERTRQDEDETRANPSIERERMKHNAREGVPSTTKPDYRSHQSEFSDKASLGPGETGRMSIRTKGDITLHRNNATLGLDGNAVKVTWRALGPDGRVQANMDPNANARHTGGLMPPGSHKQTLSPPYHNPHGWIATVTVQRNPHPVNGQSVGVSHNVTGS